MNLPDETSRPAERSPLNPYAPSAMLEGVGQDGLGLETTAYDPLPRPSLGKLSARWALVCFFSAAPSFVIAYSTQKHPPVAMLLGVLCFVIAYVWIDHHTFEKAWRQNRFVRRMLIFSYCTRIGITVIFPIGMMVDMMSGILAYSIVGVAVAPNAEHGIERQAATFGTTFLLTIVQGAILNVVLAAWWLICTLLVLSFTSLFRLIRKGSDSLSNEA